MHSESGGESNSDRTNSLELNVGERYQYRMQLFEIIAITGKHIQLRSVQQRRNICFQSYDTLALAHRRGYFFKVQEAPLLAEANKIIAGLTEKIRARLNRRLAYVRGILEKLTGSLPKARTQELALEICAQIGDTHPPSYTCIYNWMTAYLRSGENPIALISLRAKKKTYRVQKQPEEIQDLINYNIELLYHSETPATIGAVVEAITFSIEDLNSKRSSADQLRVPSESTLRRIIRELDKYETEFYQLGRRTAIKNQSWSKIIRRLRHLLERVECDTQVLDIIVVNAYGEVLGRPYLTVALDVRSRRIIGWDISLNPPSIEKTIRAIKMSLSSEHERNGLALLYVTDNGPEFVAKKLRDCLTLLGAEIRFCEPGEPNQKPFVERWFKTLTTGLIHHMKGTTFSNIQERGEYDSEAEAIFTLEQLRAAFQDWLDSVYHSDFHRGLGTSPDIFWEAHTDPAFPAKRYSNKDLKMLFLSKKVATPVNGRIGFENLQWTGPAVAYLSTLNSKKDKLTLYYDTSELGTAWVCHPDAPDDIYSIDAVDPDYQTGLTMHMHHLVMAELKEKERTFDFREARDNRVRINLRLANSKGKRARKKHARPEEYNSSNSIALTSDNGSANKSKGHSKIDPQKHLTNSQVPAVAQVMEVHIDHRHR
ncbi:transposase [Pseudomonas taiwanensis]|uniref:DDE-type integrase/transposase/recombinase n=1 Tax=Pseudomonas taiwanensis TaxID=470150 RepID=UPI0015B98E8A|nr:DDE-type integrase/transposase/recombinase [Pseudomonas taiwanensis]NWL78030.1 transposase [Pseudomonas taiwanensis]